MPNEPSTSELSGAQPEIADELDRAPLADTGAPGGPRRAAALFIFFTVALDMLALGMIAPILPRLIESMLHGSAANPTAHASELLGIFATVFAAMQFVLSPIIGSLSDRWGRRPIVLLSNFGTAFDYVLMAWAPTVGWLFLGRVVSGLTTSSVPTAQAYIADVTPPEKRAQSFGLLSAAFAVGLVIGPAVGGFLGGISPRLPFWAAAGLSLLNGVYGAFVLPESLKRENRSPFSWARANPVGSVRMLSRSPLLFGLAALLLLAYIAQQSLMNVYVLYADYRYGWTDRTVGLSFGMVGLFSGIYGGLLVRRAIAAVGERGTIIAGLLLGLGGFAMFGLAHTGRLFWLAIPFVTGIGLVWPASQSIMSRSAAANEQGQLQGAIHSLRGISGLIGPGMFTWVFARSIGAGALIHLPGSPFFLASSLLGIALIAALLLREPAKPLSA